jgi:diguanylate cyclase (GGDEF)-like protein
MGTWSRFAALVAIALLVGLVLLPRTTTPVSVVAGLLAATLALGAWTAARRPAKLGGPAHPRPGDTTADKGIAVLAKAIDARDGRTPDHAGRMQIYAAGLARAAGLPATDIEGIRLAALIRDVGKLAVPVHVLSRSEPLTTAEMTVIKTHPVVGAELVRNLDDTFTLSAVVRSHHERWDGMGYPDGLHGVNIPLGARIVGLVEYYEALTTARPYHDALTADSARTLLRREAGRAFDPDLVATFLDVLPTLNADLPTPGIGNQALATGTPGDVAPVDAFGRITEANREFHRLYDIARSMGTSLDLMDTMTLVCDKLRPLVPFSCCALFLWSDDGDTLRCRFATGTGEAMLTSESLRDQRELAAWVTQHRRPLVNGSLVADAQATGLTAAKTLDLASALVYPMEIDDQRVGALALYHVQPGFYTTEDQRRLSLLVEQLSAVVANSVRFDQAQEASLTDPLTSLPNTRSLSEHLTRELARADRLRASLAFILLDLDNFKQVNDRHGHHVGDRALCDVASTLRAAIRPYDICARYAGDEFIVILSECSADEAGRKVAELQQAVFDRGFEPQRGTRVPLRISAGIAMFPADGQTYESLLATADRQMYRDKARRQRSATPAEQAALADPAPPVAE